jgi:hypothetical protein
MDYMVHIVTVRAWLQVLAWCRGSHAFARYGGSLSHLRLDDLLGLVAERERSGVPLDRSMTSRPAS